MLCNIFILLISFKQVANIVYKIASIQGYWMGITFGEHTPHQGGTRLHSSMPLLYFAGTKIS